MRAAVLSAVLMLPLLAFAETLDLGPHGTFRITAPKGWRFSTTKEEDAGFTVVLAPPAGVNASFLLNIVFAPKGETMSKEDVREKVLGAGDQYVESSVEKKKVLREFSLPGDAYGAYCAFTDASYVGKPPQKDYFRMVAVGIIRFNDEVSAAVSLAYDEEKGPEIAAMLEAISSAAVSRK